MTDDASDRTARTPPPVDDEPVVQRRDPFRFFRARDGKPPLLRRWSGWRVFFLGVGGGSAIWLILTTAGENNRSENIEEQPVVRPDVFEGVPFDRSGGQPIGPLVVGQEAPSEADWLHGDSLGDAADLPSETSAVSVTIARLQEANETRAAEPELGLERGVAL